MVGFRRIHARRPLLCASYSTRDVERTPSLPHAWQVPKTIVFFDSRKEAYDAIHASRNWLEESDGHQYSKKKQARETVKVFHRDRAKFDKAAIIAEFQRLAEDSPIRVIFATEALGLGVNLPDVRRVVLYRLPKGEEPAIMWQRGEEPAETDKMVK